MDVVLNYKVILNCWLVKCAPQGFCIVVITQTGHPELVSGSTDWAVCCGRLTLCF